ncbi:hypothetical protein RJT34_17051 [Clitoria ternatea]|uniref:Exocyst subunit Exo70 family protein n=1 Tax=Clitoria ternatea TaxID=43366 RepID=A0AAN9PED2_CLITE
MMENSALDIIFQWDSEQARDMFIFHDDRRDVERYLQAVHEIQRFGDYNDIQMAMSRLELEFRNILISHTNPTSHLNTQKHKQKQLEKTCGCFGFFRFHSSSASPKRHDDDVDQEPFGGDDDNKEDEDDNNKPVSDDDDLDRDSLVSSSGSFRDIRAPFDPINELCCIAERMISSGYMCQCIETFATVRKSLIDDTLRRLGIDDDVRWEQVLVVAKIQRWTQASRICFKTLFANEKKLCDEVFEGVESTIAEACFMETVKAPAIQILNLANTICVSLTPSTDNLFEILYLYGDLEDLIPVIHSLFVSESIRVMAAEVLSRLAEASREAFYDYENNLLRDTPKVVVPADGSFHSLTTYVMNYLSLISKFDYMHILNKLIVSKPAPTPDMDFAYKEEQKEGKTPFEMHLIWIIEMLHFKLDDSSKQYKDKSLSHIFIMNNVHRILQGVRESSFLMQAIGNDYLKKLIQKIRLAATGYQRASWGMVLNCLTSEMSGSKQIRRRTKTFNGMFEKVHRTQAVWSIVDPQLREDLQLSILQKLIPAYRSWIRRYGKYLCREGRTVDYVKYSVVDLNNVVFDFFQGIRVSQHLNKRSLGYSEELWEKELLED